MPRRLIPDETKAAAIEAVRTGASTRDAAAEFGVSASALRGWLARAGVQSSVRAGTEKATQAKIATMAASRAELARLLLEDAHRLRVQMWQPASVAMVVNLPDKMGSTVIDHQLTEPTFRDKQAIMVSAAVALDKHLKIVQFDGSPELAAAKSLLESVFDAAAKSFGTGDDLVRGD